MHSPSNESPRVLAPYDWPRRGPGRVLVVDDDDGIRAVMKKQLAYAGFDVVTAPSAREGLDAMRADDSIRLVLLDMMMPTVDGWGFRQAQLADAAISTVPVIVLTGAPLPSLVHAQLRAADYLLKPVGREHLVSVVSNYCEPQAPPDPPADAPSSPALALGYAQP